MAGVRVSADLTFSAVEDRLDEGAEMGGLITHAASTHFTRSSIFTRQSLFPGTLWNPRK